MLVYVLNNNGQPLMPTSRFGKVRRLLKSNKAKVVKRCPFTIQLLYQTDNITQDITLGVDAGSKVIGISVTSKKEELYASEVTLRNDIVELLSIRRQLRSSRRNRKTRYRAPRYDNRVSSKKQGWLAPSINQKVNSHLKVIEDIHSILPITRINLEVASFDIQKINNPEIHSKQYQQGEQLDFFNVREYVLFRDNHICQCCKGKSKDKILNVHHIESRQIGGNAPNNLITLCETCHNKYHKGLIELPIKRGTKFKDASFMGVMRWALYNKLKKMYPNVSLTYGYITKNTRIENNLEKDHYIDARCISDNPKAKPLGIVYYQKKVRCHNRQIHKMTISKGGYRKLNQAPYLVKGFRLFDKVNYNNIECFITGRRQSGSTILKTIDGTSIHNGIGFKHLKFIEPRKNYLTEAKPIPLVS